MLISSKTVLSQTYKESNTIQRAWDLGIGIGLGTSTNPFIGADDVPAYFALDFSIYGERFFFDNGELGFTVFNKKNTGVNLIVTYNNERIYYTLLNKIGITIINPAISTNSFVPTTRALVEINNNTIITPVPVIPPGTILPSPLPPGTPPFEASKPLSFYLPVGENILLFDIPNKKSSLNIGFELLHDFSWASVNFQATTDAIGIHSGYESLLNISKSWGNYKWKYSLHGGLHWKSKQLVNYYYGVDYAFDSIVGIKYNPEASLNLLFGFQTSYRVSNNLSFVSSFNYTSFGQSIRNSPLVDQNHTLSFFTGVLYRF